MRLPPRVIQLPAAALPKAAGGAVAGRSAGEAGACGSATAAGACGAVGAAAAGACCDVHGGCRAAGEDGLGIRGAAGERGAAAGAAGAGALPRPAGLDEQPPGLQCLQDSISFGV